MALRTTSTGIPRMSMRWPLTLVLTLCLHDLEYRVYESFVAAEFGVDSVADLAFLNFTSPPIRFLHPTDGAI